MQIRELEQITKLERPTIRYYEQEGLIQPIRRENGYRDYSQEDLDTLLKIKLLRQLGMPIEMIRDLQQGRESFSQALNEQIRRLETQKQLIDRAERICMQMLDDGVSYDQLDAGYYLEMLSRPALNEPVFKPKPVLEFQSDIMREVHPFRRYIARMIDYSWLQIIVQVIVFYVFRIRYSYALYQILSIVTGLGGLLLAIPVNGFLIHKWGTTLGKWIMGISIRSCNGDTLGLHSAMRREYQALKQGFGWGLPIYRIVRLIKSYRRYKQHGTNDWDYDWDYDAEATYQRFSLRLFGLYAANTVVFGIIVFLTAFHMFSPKYMGNQLTIEQFSTNYNYVSSMLNQSWTTPLDSNGLMKRVQVLGERIIYLGGEPAEFQFETEDGVIRSIQYHNELKDPIYGRAVPTELINAIGTLLLSDNVSLIEYVNILKDYVLESKSGSIRVHNIEAKWNTVSSGYVQYGQTLYRADNANEKAQMKIIYDFELIIHPD